MKTPIFAVLFLSAASGLAQTSAKPVHHSVPAKRPAATCATDAPPATPAGLPPAEGPVQKAYALRYIDTVVGTGELAPPTGFFTVHYTGWLASDGSKFDSSVDRGEPITFPVGAHRVIIGWDTGFAGMHVGGKRRLFIPYQLAYGEQGRPPAIPAKADLIFDVELISVSATPPVPKAPVAPQTQAAPQDKAAPQTTQAPPPAQQPAAGNSEPTK